jgi:tetraacyldisaccharide 4'-kinase
VRARLVPHVPQAEDRDRRRGARSLRAAHPEVDVFVLDDAFQHFAVRRDLDVVLLDATRPLARDHLLPRGRLREGPSALARAGLVVLTRADLVGEEALAEQEGHARRFTAAPFLRAASRASGVEVGGRTEPATWLRGRAVHALSGLGNPDAFVRTLERAGARVVGRRDLGDHAAPSDERFLRYAEEGLEGGAEWVVVTRKDAVKRGALPARVAVLDVEAEILAGEDLLWRRVGEALAAGRGEGGREGAG